MNNREWLNVNNIILGLSIGSCITMAVILWLWLHRKYIRNIAIPKYYERDHDRIRFLYQGQDEITIIAKRDIAPCDQFPCVIIEDTMIHLFDLLLMLGKPLKEIALIFCFNPCNTSWGRFGSLPPVVEEERGLADLVGKMVRLQLVNDDSHAEYIFVPHDIQAHAV